MTKLTANDGFVFALKDKSAVYDNIIYLSDIDSADRYIQLPINEATKLKEDLASKLIKY